MSSIPISQEGYRMMKRELENLKKRLAKLEIGLTVTDAALSEVAKEGFDPVFGARPLKREIQRHLLNPLSVKLLEGNILDGATIKADSDGKTIVFS